ncbi:hypothetical protein QE152_g14008 [Popillia japonica]|uniref:Uncharacterized protein n=1 Tax=Popillia japonica TaxID=7064 RepID=A0AAW1L9F0_POPJA
MKRYYRRQVLRKILVEGEDEEGVLANRKKNGFEKLHLHGGGSLVVTLRHAWKLKAISTEEMKEKKKKEKETQCK